MPTSPPAQTQIYNPDFEAGNTGWILSPGSTIINDGAQAFAGVWLARFDYVGATTGVANDLIVPVYPGQVITASARCAARGVLGYSGTFVSIAWNLAGGGYVRSDGNFVEPAAGPPNDSGYQVSSVVGIAPPTAISARLSIYSFQLNPTGFGRGDDATWDYAWDRTVLLTSPLDAATYAVGDPITFSVTIGGTTPAIQSVTYKSGAIVLGTSTTGPYTVVSTTVPAGPHTITAEVLGADDSLLISNSVNITVGPATDEREFRASNSYTYLIAEKFSGLTANMPSTALVTGVEVVLDYTVEARIRSKDIGQPDPLLSDPSVAFDITDGGEVEMVLLSSTSGSYTVMGTPVTEPILLDETDFNIVEEGESEAKKWTVMDSAPFSVLVGSKDDFFGLTPQAAFDFTDMALGFRFYPKLLTKPAYADSGDACFRFMIDRIRLRVYFDAGSAEYYFASPDKTQIIKGELVSSYVSDGNFKTGDALGILQLQPTLEIMSGSQTWIGDDWTIHSAYPPTDDNQIGEVAERTAADGIGMSYNGLPTAHAIVENRSRYEFISANFFADKALDSIYGVHGLPRAFAYNGTFFYKIYTQPDPEKDKPRHVAYHHGHLALGFEEGRVDISVIGQPWNFDGALGASSWSIGDKVTGLLSLAGTILGMFGASSVWGLSGTTVDNFATQVISPNIGAIEYTISDMGFPVYANAYGIYTLAQTQQYGDYLGSPMSQDISPWLKPRLVRKYTSDKEVVAAWPVRSKNQYRIVFSDGYVATMTLNAGQQAAPTFSFQQYYLYP